MDTQKRIVVWFSALLIVIVTALGAYQVATGPRAELTKKDGALSTPVSQTDHTKGAQNAKVVFVEYSDFQCPACGAYYSLLEEMFATYKDRLSFTYRHFPLPQHQNALPASYVAEAASNQGKFWEMSDLLFKNQSEWSEVTDPSILFEGYAQKIGLNLPQYKTDVVSDAVKSKVENDRKGGTLSAIDRTPTFFINGKMVDNPQSKEELTNLIENALKNS